MVDLETGHVTICAAPLTVRFNPTLFYQNKRLILFGGEDDKYRLAPCIEMYDMATNQWTEIATIPVSARSAASMAFVYLSRQGVTFVSMHIEFVHPG